MNYVVLHDKYRLLSADGARAWFKKAIGHEPDKLYAPSTGWNWWYIGYVTPDQYKVICPPREGPTSPPYRDPPYDETTSLFKDIQAMSTTKRNRRILIHPQAFNREKFYMVAGDYSQTVMADEKLVVTDVIGEQTEIWVINQFNWADKDIVASLIQANANVDVATLNVTPDGLKAYFAINPLGTWPLNVPSSVPPPSPPSPSPQAQGIDVSHWQGTMNWAKARSAGIDFAFIKATEGASTRDSQFKTNWANAKSAGIYRGAYHFYREGVSPTAQAGLLVSTMQETGDLGDLPPVLDVETATGSPTPLPDGVFAALNEIKLLTGRKPLLYTNPAWLSLVPPGHALTGAVDLWVAHWNVDKPFVPTGWQWAFWQYSSQGDGLTYGATSSRIDLDWFVSDENALRDYVKSVTGQPPPPTTQPFKLLSPVPSIPLFITDPLNTPRDYDGDGIYDDKHEGLDIRAVDSLGRPVQVVACADGIVEQDQDRVGGGYGIAVVLRHDWPDGNVYKTWYAHLTENHVSLGQTVKAGQVIGLSGTTGNSTGIHLHLNLQWIGHGLSGYVISDVVDPTPYLPTTSPPPPPTIKYTGGYGLHGDADGAQIETVEIEAARQAGLLNNPQGWWKWYQPTRDSYAILEQNGIPASRQLLRLSHVPERKPPDFYVNGSTGIWDWPLKEALASGVRHFELGNEVNAPSEGMGTAWTSPSDYCQTHLLPIISNIERLYLPQYPDTKLITPGLSPSFDDLLWWETFKALGVLARCHGLGVHSYWDKENGLFPMESVEGGRHYRNAFPFLPYLKPSGKLWLSEVSNNKALDTDSQKGDQYARWLKGVESDKVGGVFFYVVKGNDFDSSRETWVRQGNIISVIPTAFKAKWDSL